MRWSTALVALLCAALALGTVAGGYAIARSLSAADGPGTLAQLREAEPVPRPSPVSPAPQADLPPDAGSPDSSAQAPVVTVPALTQPAPTAEPTPATQPTAPDPPPVPGPGETPAAPPAADPGPAAPAPAAPAPAPEGPVAVVPPYSTVLGWHGDQRVAYLKFDDGPGPATPRILDVLAAAGVKATFCVLGQRVTENPELAVRIAVEGHTLCNHSWDHRSPFDALSADELDQQIVGTQQAIAQVTGVTARYFRAPQGRFGDTGGAVLQACQRAQTVPLGWGVDSLDWKRPGTPAVVAGILSAVTPGAVILMHDGGGVDREQSIEALPAVIAGLQAAGYTISPLPSDPVG